MSELLDPLSEAVQVLQRRVRMLEERALDLERCARTEREERVSPIPTSVSYSQVAAAVKALGIDLGTKSMRSMEIDGQKVRLETVDFGGDLAVAYVIPIR